MRAKDPRYDLIKPVWVVVRVLVMMRCRLASPSGPIFLYHVMSIRSEAIFCPV